MIGVTDEPLNISKAVLEITTSIHKTTLSPTSRHLCDDDAADRNEPFSEELPQSVVELTSIVKEQTTPMVSTKLCDTSVSDSVSGMW